MSHESNRSGSEVWKRSQDIVLPEDGLQGAGVELGVLRDLVDDVGQVCEEVALVLVGQDGGHASVVELDVLVVDFDEVEGGVCWYERLEGIGDDL